jgi:4-hydroxybenzoate polyprenyltransferase
MIGTIVRSSHPVPTFAVTTLSLLLAIAFGVQLDHTILIVVAVFFNQIAIGLSNDVIDVARDRRAGRTDKPLVTGAISLSRAWVVVVGSSIVSLALSVLVNPWVGVWQAVFLFSGFAYNAGLKATVLSALPYATGFAALPILVSLGTLPPSWPAWWVIFVGASLGVSAHFANVLPDGDSDRAEGIRGLPQRLPRAVTVAALVAITTLSSAILIWQGGVSAVWVTVPAAIAAVGVSLAAAMQAGRTPTTAWPFRLSMLAAGFLVLGLVGALRGG